MRHDLSFTRGRFSGQGVLRVEDSRLAGADDVMPRSVLSLDEPYAGFPVRVNELPQARLFDQLNQLLELIEQLATHERRPFAELRTWIPASSSLARTRVAVAIAFGESPWTHIVSIAALICLP